MEFIIPEIITIKNVLDIFDGKYLARGLYKYNSQCHFGQIDDNTYGPIYTHDEKFVYGYPAVFDHPKLGKLHMIIEAYSHSIGGVVSPSTSSLIVEPGTIGCYSGRNDCNGTPVFEQDIVEYQVNEAIPKGYRDKRLAVVTFSESNRRWILSARESWRRSHFLEDATYIRIIGNTIESQRGI